MVLGSLARTARVLAVALLLTAPGVLAHAQTEKDKAPPAVTVLEGAPPLIGRWGDNGDCRDFIEFRENGTFYSSSTGGEGAWTLLGGQLTLSGAGGVFPVQIRFLDNDHQEITHPDGSVGYSQRCPY